MVTESYDLVTFAERAQREPLCSLLQWLPGEAARQGLSVLKGYDLRKTGQQVNV